MFGRPAPGRDPVGPRPLRAARPAAGRIAQQSASTPGSSSRHPGQRPPAQRTAPRGGGMLAWPPRPLTSSSSCSSPCARARRQRQPNLRPLPAPPLSPVAAPQQGASGLGPGGAGRAAATRRSRGARLLSRADQRQRHAVRQEGPHAVLAPGAAARGDPRLLPTVDPLPPMHPACMRPRSWVHGSMFNQPLHGVPDKRAFLPAQRLRSGQARSIARWAQGGPPPARGRPHPGSTPAPCRWPPAARRWRARRRRPSPRRRRTPAAACARAQAWRAAPRRRAPATREARPERRRGRAAPARQQLADRLQQRGDAKFDVDRAAAPHVPATRGA